MKKKQLLMALVVALFVSGTVGVQAASAATTSTTTNAVANTTTNTRPGWGNGDKNHHHVGPPGQSGRPGGHKPTRAEIIAFFAHIRQEIRDFFNHFA